MPALKKHVWAQTLTDNNGVAVVPLAPQTVYGDVEANFQVSVNPSSTVEVDMVVDITKIQSGSLYSDQNATIHTNASDGTGGQTITLTGGLGYCWNTAKGGSNPFTPTITKFFITNNSSTTAATVRGDFLLQE